MENTETIVANTEREAVVATAPKADLSKLSNEPWLQENVNTFEPIKQEPTTNANVEEQEKNDAENAADLEIVKTPEELEADKLAAEKPLEVEDKPLEIENVALEIDNNEVPEDSWLALAKSQGLEIAEDSMEAFVDAKIKPYVEQLEEVKTAKVEDYLTEVDPQIRMQIELNKAGLSYEEIKAPLENINNYRNMNPVELVREDLTLKISNIRELTEDDKAFIDAEIEKKVESGEINHDHKRLMLMLDESEKQIKDEQQSIVDKYKVNSARVSEEKRSNEIASVSKALTEVQSFMGSTIGKDSLTAMSNKYGKGEYDHVKNNPDFMAKALLYYELGEKAYTSAIAKSEAKGRLSITKELHNTPPLDNVGGGKSTTIQETKTGLARLKDEPGLKA